MTAVIWFIIYGLYYLKCSNYKLLIYRHCSKLHCNWIMFSMHDQSIGVYLSNICLGQFLHIRVACDMSSMEIESDYICCQLCLSAACIFFLLIFLMYISNMYCAKICRGVFVPILAWPIKQLKLPKKQLRLLKSLT